MTFYVEFDLCDFATFQILFPPILFYQNTFRLTYANAELLPNLDYWHHILQPFSARGPLQQPPPTWRGPRPAPSSHRPPAANSQPTGGSGLFGPRDARYSHVGQNHLDVIGREKGKYGKGSKGKGKNRNRDKSHENIAQKMRGIKRKLDEKEKEVRNEKKQFREMQLKMDKMPTPSPLSNLYGNLSISFSNNRPRTVDRCNLGPSPAPTPPPTPGPTPPLSPNPGRASMKVAPASQEASSASSLPNLAPPFALPSPSPPRPLLPPSPSRVLIPDLPPLPQLFPHPPHRNFALSSPDSPPYILDLPMQPNSPVPFPPAPSPPAHLLIDLSIDLPENPPANSVPIEAAEETEEDVPAPPGSPKRWVKRGK